MTSSAYASDTRLRARARWLKVLVPGLLPLMAALAGCEKGVAPPIGSSGNHAQTPRRGGWLRVSTYTDLRTLDSAVAFDEGSHAIEQLIFAKLVDFSEKTGAIKGDLAERWQVSGDGLRYHFWLRKGALFHDGSEVTAADAKRSLERMLHPHTPCPVASFYSRIAGFKQYVKGKAPHLSGVNVLSKYELEVRLSEADGSLLSLLALPTASVLCKSAGSRYSRDFSNQPCGAGPYRFDSWQHGRKLRVKRFESYYRAGYPYLDGIEWQLRVPVFSQQLKFSRGELDWVRELSALDRGRYARSKAWRGRGEWEAAHTIRGVFLNTEMPPFRDKRIRQAAAYAINRKHLAQLHQGDIEPAYGLLPAAIAGHRPGVGQHYQPKKALALMAAAGYPYNPKTGKGGYPHEIEYYTVANSFGQTSAELFQQQLAKIGLRIRIRGMGWPAYLALTGRRGRTAMGSDGWVADYPSPANFFESLFVKAAINPEESQNRAFYANNAFDKLIADARHTTDRKRRMAFYQQAEDKLIADAPWIFTHATRRFELWHPYVHGYRIHKVHPSDLGKVWLSPRKPGALGLKLGRPGERGGLRGFVAALTRRWRSMGRRRYRGAGRGQRLAAGRGQR